MTVSRDVILDLLPVYLAGEGSPATRELVEAFLKEDPELAQHVRLQWAENFRRIAPSTLPPELELRALSRTRARTRGCAHHSRAAASIAQAGGVRPPTAITRK